MTMDAYELLLQELERLAASARFGMAKEQILDWLAATLADYARAGELKGAKP